MILNNPESGRSFRVIWAIDPYASDYLAQRSALQVLQTLTRGVNVEVTPVFLYGAHPYKSIETVNDDKLSQLKSSAQEAIKRILEGLINEEEHIKLFPLVVIAEPFLRIGDATKELIHYAKDQGSDCILLNTHARKGIGRLVLGSFAEELTLQSEVPILAVNPHCDLDAKRRIIFATDFSEESRKAFLQVIELARSTEMPVTLFYQARFPLRPVMRYAFNPYPIYDRVAETEVQQKRTEASEWVRQAQKAGIQISVKFDEYEKPVADGILGFSRQVPGVLALTARSGKFEAILLGSTTRKVLREACCPVWIVHPEQEMFSLKKMEVEPNQSRVDSYAVWEGGLKTGHGSFSSSDGAGSNVPLTYASRFGGKGGLTPEGLLATAEAACVAMSFAGELERRKLKGERIDVASTVKFLTYRGGVEITNIDLSTTVFMGAGNRVATQDAYDSAIRNSVISKALSVRINAKLDVRSPSLMANEGKRKTA